MSSTDFRARWAVQSGGLDAPITTRGYARFVDAWRAYDAIELGPGRAKRLLHHGRTIAHASGTQPAEPHRALF